MPEPARKVLIVSPHFPPINAPDMQRVRLALPYLRSQGWEPVVLAVAPDLVEGGVIEPLLEDTYPGDIRVIRVRGISPTATRWLGIGSLWLRCGRAIRSAGERLLETEKFDLVFFSTTQFDAFNLGPVWKARFGVPYFLDYQDPWVNDYYERTHTKPPGGRLKFAFSQWRARRSEPRVLRGAAGAISVSDAYPATLARTYRWFEASSMTLLTFGASVEDIATAKKHKPAESLVPFGDGNFHHVYTGRCGPDMSRSLTIIFRAFKKYLAARPEEAGRIRFHFIGTDYAPRPFGREWAMPVAKGEGIGSFVSEHCYRVPYFDALYYLLNADALVGIGSNDPTYSASKIYPYILARRPMLLVYNEHSQVLAAAQKLKSGERYMFVNSGGVEELVDRVAAEWFLGGGMLKYTGFDEDAFATYSAAGMTRKLAECFDAALRKVHGSS
jgi:hypothetical protein